ELLAALVELDRVAGGLVLVALDLCRLELGGLLLAQRGLRGLVVARLHRDHRALLPLRSLLTVLLDVVVELLRGRLIRHELLEGLLAALLELEDRHVELLLRIDCLVERGVRLARNAVLDPREDAHAPRIAQAVNLRAQRSGGSVPRSTFGSLPMPPVVGQLPPVLL